MDKTIYDMSVSELHKLIQSKEKEYRDAFKAKKVFWEIKRIMEQKRELERQLVKKNIQTI